MKTLRKSLAILLCVIMPLSYTNVAFAEEIGELEENQEDGIEVASVRGREIKLNAGKGEVDSGSIILEDGQTLPQQLPEATRTGWIFEGWYTAEVMENYWGDDESESFSALLKKYGDDREKAVKKDFTWIIESEGTLAEAGKELPDDVDTLYAMYAPTNNITIRWYYNGWKKNTGIFLTHNNKEYDSPVVFADLESFLSWEDHEFVGWYTEDGTEWKFEKAISDRDNGKVYYVSNNVVTKDIDLYAHWVGNTDPDTIKLNYKNELIEPGMDVSVTASYSPVSADAPELEWSVNDDSNMVASQVISNDGLKITLTIDENADAIQSNKYVTVTAKSKTNPALSSEVRITIGHSWKMVGYEDSTCDKPGVKHYQCTKHINAQKDVILDPDGHRFVKSNTITKAPTCVKKGSYTDVYTCRVCNAIDEVVTEVPATGQHEYRKTTTVVDKEADCGNDGLHTDTYECTVCGSEKTEQVTDPATGEHDFYEYVNLNLGIRNHYQSCKVCGKTEFLYAEKTELDDCVIVLSETDYIYNGSAKEPDVTVSNGSTKLVINQDYTVSYSNNVNVGTATVEIIGKGDYTGSETKTFTINKADNSITASDIIKPYSKKKQSFSIGAKSLENVGLTYSSDNKSVKVNSSGEVTVKAKFMGKATITINSASTAGYNSVSKEITVTIYPSAPTLTNVKNNKGNKMLVRWKKNTTVTGYEIQYSTDDTFEGEVNTIIVPKKGAASKTIKYLENGETYKVRVRAYKTVSGIKYYSEWSDVKEVTIVK